MINQHSVMHGLAQLTEPMMTRLASLDHNGSWWHHQMKTFSVLPALWTGNSPVTGEFPSQRPVTRSFYVFFELCLNKKLSKRLWGWWFEMPSRPLWHQCNGWRSWISETEAAVFSLLVTTSYHHIDDNAWCNKRKYCMILLSVWKLSNLCLNSKSQDKTRQIRTPVLRIPPAVTTQAKMKNWLHECQKWVSHMIGHYVHI